MVANVSRRRWLLGLQQALRREDGEPGGPRVVAIGESCLARSGITCASCVDACEPRALRLAPRPGGRFLPVIDLAACTGCGHCLGPCPVGALKLHVKESTWTSRVS